MKRMICLALAAVLFSCGAAFGQEVKGSGEWRSVKTKAIRGTWTLSATRSGTALNGVLELTGSNVFTGGEVAGSIDGSDIVLGVLRKDQKLASFTGAIDGEAVSGEWECDLVDDAGVWYGDLSRSDLSKGQSASQ